MRYFITSFLMLFVFAVSSKAQTVVVVNSASYQAGFVTSHQLSSIFGDNLASQTAVATSLPLPETLGGISVVATNTSERFSGPVQLLFVSPTQINFVFPEYVSGTVTLTVERNDIVTHTVDVRVAGINPGIFTETTVDRYKAPAGNASTFINGGYTNYSLVDRTTGRLSSLPKFKPDNIHILSIYGTGFKYSNFPFRTLVMKNIQSSVEYRLEADYSGPSLAYVGLDLVNIRLGNTTNTGYFFPEGVYECFVEYRTLTVGQIYRSNIFNLRLE